jgi:hypothetical protein
MDILLIVIGIFFLAVAIMQRTGPAWITLGCVASAIYVLFRGVGIVIFHA